MRTCSVHAQALFLDVAAFMRVVQQCGVWRLLLGVPLLWLGACEAVSTGQTIGVDISAEQDGERCAVMASAWVQVDFECMNADPGKAGIRTPAEALRKLTINEGEIIFDRDFEVGYDEVSEQAVLMHPVEALRSSVIRGYRKALLYRLATDRRRRLRIERQHFSFYDCNADERTQPTCKTTTVTTMLDGSQNNETLTHTARNELRRDVLETQNFLRHLCSEVLGGFFRSHSGFDDEEFPQTRCKRYRLGAGQTLPTFCQATTDSQTEDVAEDTSTYEQ